MKRGKDDCLRQCVARVTGRKPSQVPHFVGRYKGRWLHHLSIWCKRTGHICLYFRKTKDVDRIFFAGATPNECIAIGPSKGRRAKTNKRIYHAIVVNARGKIVWDGGVGITRCESTLVIGKARP